MAHQVRHAASSSTVHSTQCTVLKCMLVHALAKVAMQENEASMTARGTPYTNATVKSCWLQKQRT